MTRYSLAGLFALGVMCAPAAWAAPDIPLQQVVDTVLSSESSSGYIRVIVLTTLIALIPVLLISVTAFTRIVIVLSAVRMGLGMQETPSSSVIITLALCLTLFAMAPTGQQISAVALQPWLAEKISTTEFIRRASVPLKDFMLQHVRSSDLDLMAELASNPRLPVTPVPAADVPLHHLVPAFMLSELKTAFQMAFMVLLPFLLIDLLVSVGLMSLGMMMVPPTTIALPLKILMFVLVDGWAVIARSLVTGVLHGAA